MEKIYLLAHVTAKPGREEELNRVMRSLLAPTLAEPGCEQYSMYASDQPGQFFVNEIWTTRSALDAHLQTLHFKAAADRFPELLEGRLGLHFLTPLTP